MFLNKKLVFSPSQVLISAISYTLVLDPGFPICNDVFFKAIQGATETL